MPRSNRPRGRKPGSGDAVEPDLSTLLSGWRHTESKRDGEWNVQPVPAAKALKVYLCPGCSLEIATGREHLVAWRADGVTGDAADLAARRHWHTHCWRLK
ncbi:hypothetical protein GCM10022381_10790 [Leifsonia kafniensis]|uniref:ATP/GTP-binding protein n=1 Tax=Leifsonia kafniensis TaxID=475957 RepID=A0ABP7KA49_9MICO